MTFSEFEHKYPSILSRFYKQKLSELEEETQQLLTFKKLLCYEKNNVVLWCIGIL